MNSVTKYKFFGGLILILFLGASVIYGIRFYRDRADLKALADYNTYLDKFKNDTIGGKTPEETLKMFVAALKKGDVELASQYFSLDDKGSRQKWVDYLKSVQSKNLLVTMANDIEKEARPFGNASSGRFTYKIYDKDGTVGVTIDLSKNIDTWKIISL